MQLLPSSPEQVICACSGERGNKSERLVSDFGINIPYLFHYATNFEWNASFGSHSVIIHVGLHLTSGPIDLGVYH